MADTDEIERVLTKVAPGVLSPLVGYDVKFVKDPRVFVCSEVEESSSDGDGDSDEASDEAGDEANDKASDKASDEVSDECGAISVHMHSNQNIVHEYGPSFHRLSLCDMSYDKERPELSVIVFNRDNWTSPRLKERFGGTHEAYHDYLVCHEFGHALGLLHTEDPGKDKPCTVMVQQTPVTTKCDVGV